MYYTLQHVAHRIIEPRFVSENGVKLLFARAFYALVKSYVATNFAGLTLDTWAQYSIIDRELGIYGQTIADVK